MRTDCILFSDGFHPSEKECPCSRRSSKQECDKSGPDERSGKHRKSGLVSIDERISRLPADRFRYAESSQTKQQITLSRPLGHTDGTGFKQGWNVQDQRSQLGKYHAHPGTRHNDIECFPEKLLRLRRSETCLTEQVPVVRGLPLWVVRGPFASARDRMTNR